jgi:subtilisin family serine protease
MRNRKIAWFSVLGLGMGLLLSFSATAQLKGQNVPWERPRDWDMYTPDMDYAPGTFIVAFTSQAKPEVVQEIIRKIEAFPVKSQRPVKIVDASQKYFGRLEKEPLVPKAVVRSTSSGAADARAGAAISKPNVCGNLIKYFEFGDLAGDELASLIEQLNAEIAAKYPDDIYSLQAETTGYPKQTPSPDWAKPAISATAEPLETKGVTVAVLDSGYTPTPGYTPDRSWNAVFRKGLGSAAVPNPLFGSTMLKDIPDDYFTKGSRGHGTGVASIIRGPEMIDQNTFQGVVDMKPNTLSLTSDANIYPIKVCDVDTCSSVSIAIGICKAISDPQYPVGVINLSLAGPPNTLVDGAVRDALAANVTVVASAAHINTRTKVPAGTPVIKPAFWNETPGQYTFDYPYSPAGLSKGGSDPKNADGIISVGAAERAVGGFEWAIFTPRAPRWAIQPDQDRIVTNLNKSVDLMAPGKDVVALPNDAKFPMGHLVSGTSYAAPYVSAAAAILLGRNPTLTPAKLEKVLLDAARLHPVDCPPGFCGAGMVNVQGGLDLLNSATYLSANGITP